MKTATVPVQAAFWLFSSLLPLAALAQPENAPKAALQVGSALTPLNSGQLGQMVLGLAVVLGLIGAAAWFLRRHPRLRGAEGAIKVVGGPPLGARERLLLVEVEGERLLLGVAPGRVQTLHRCEPSFSASLAQAKKTRGNHE